MKKNAIAIAAAVALVLLAVPAIASANGMHQTGLPFGGAGAVAHRVAHTADADDATTAVESAIASARSAYGDRADAAACDAYAESREACPGYVDADGDGVCDDGAAYSGACPGYANADDNGACDGHGTGAHRGCGNAAGNGHHGRMHR